jgi:signal transduction histidine kinase
MPRRATQKVTLVIHGGIAPVRLLAHRVNRLLDQFQDMLDRNQREFNGIAHDLRGPLTRLLLRLEILKEQDQPDSELIAGLDADLKALVALDQDLGELAQPQGRSLHREWLNLEPCCREVAASYNADLVIVAMDPQLRVLTDHRMLQRTLHNLIENALEYGGAPVRISAVIIDEALVISVEDSGINGCHPSFVELDLPPPHQGMGLAIARGFCLSHEGRMELGESTLGGWHVSLHLRAVPIERSAA